VARIKTIFGLAFNLSGCAFVTAANDANKAIGMFLFIYGRLSA